MATWSELVMDSAQYVRNVLRGNWPDDPAIFRKCTLDQPPVLLLHGFLGTRGALFVLEQRLLAQGFTVFSVNLGALNVSDIRKSARRIQKGIQGVIAKSRGRVDQIDIVGHSMGGLIGLCYAQIAGEEKGRVRKLVTLGTPYGGTWLSLAGAATLGIWSPSTWQMIPGSLFLRGLRNQPVPQDLEMASVFGEFDFLCPPKTAYRSSCVNYQVPLGHASLTLSQDVHRIIARILHRPQRPGRDKGKLFEQIGGRFIQRPVPTDYLSVEIETSKKSKGGSTKRKAKRGKKTRVKVKSATAS